MECGQAVDLKDIYGQRPIRFVAQCGGRWLMISHSLTNPRNGYMFSDWRGVVRELVAMAVPRSLETERGYRAESLAGGLFHDIPLSYPLSVQGIAGVVGEDIEAVRELLADLAVQAD